MASVIACAGKRLCMGQGAFLMIHNPWTVTMGNAEDLRKDAATLDKMRDSILTFYQSKSTKTADELKELMDAETWISREMANDFGFEVEDYEGELKAAASLSRRAFAKAPDAAKALVQFKAEKPTAPEAPETPAGAPAPTDGEEPAPTPETPAGATEAAPEPTPAPEGNWEERFKGLCNKFNAAQKAGMEALAQQEAKFKAEIEARDAQIKDFKSQLETSAKDLADANAKVSELSAKLDESTKALQTANADLAQTRDSLQKAEDKAAELEKTRDLLTAGVLTPAPEGSTYAEKMKAAKTPEERELARKAFDNILAMSFKGSTDISKDGSKEVANAVMRKYESLN
jgi:predicted  nucleic acid-binding Zn-ribbon protein